MGWLKKKLFSRKKSEYRELAENLHQALVAEGGPSKSAQSHIDAAALDIPLGRLERFSQKRRISLEAMLFVAVQMETSEKSEKLEMILGEGNIHPLAVEIGRVTAESWRSRGIELKASDVGEQCFSEVEEFLQYPFRWGRAWLDEFYDDREKSGDHYILWTEQWLKEFNTMRDMVKRYS